MNQRRTAGVLMHLTSLPGKYGTGVMGKEAKQFIDRLFAMDFHLWQVLPLNPVDMSGSPYCSVSAFAGNISLIDPFALFESGLITEVTPPDYELRAAILKRKATIIGIDLPKDVVTFLAESIRSNVRQLEGAVKKLSAFNFIKAIVMKTS